MHDVKLSDGVVPRHVEPQVSVDPENSRSAAVARRSGFTYDKRVPEADGNPCDRYVRNLTADRVTTPRPR
ncbi:GNAT family protein [Streptomyces sp. Root431]|uniref:GNAT family N-acetyltransferase n=1 Tax=Streptomyces sp. Root431 TaxID=1736535 RepID=UPI000ACA1DB9|nr:GNAT family protein [Streptomyces sp. Root431]